MNMNSVFNPPGNGVLPGPNMPPHATGNGVPPSPNHLSDPDDESTYQLPDLEPTSRVWGKHGFALVVQQQPYRARMCGFGDKDRRPITPAAIVKLLIFDAETGQEIDYEKKMNWSRLILQVDLWNVHGNVAENCVLPSEGASAISGVHVSAFPPTPGVMSARTQQHLRPYQIENNAAFIMERERTNARYPNGHYYPGRPLNGHNGAHQSHHPSPAESSSSSTLAQSPQSQSPHVSRTSEPHKNLIGQCHTSLQQLDGLDDKKGLFFIFQDLSVRTEGWFRLKCVLYAIGNLGLDGEPAGPTAGATTGTSLFFEAPCLAAAFTKPFKVFSAKKFPGVVETTDWSAHLAKQGIKIPIRNSETNKRKRGGNAKGRNGDGDDDADEEE